MKGYISAFVLLFASLTSGSALATTFVNRPLGDVVKETPIIVRGRPGDSYSAWDKTGRKAIHTYTDFTITEVLKGEISETRITLRQPGGAKDGVEMNVPGTAHFVPEEDVVVLLGDHNAEDDSYDVPGFATGKYNVVPGENGQPVLVNSLGGGAIYDPNKDPRTLSYNSKIPLEVFRRVARGEDIPEAAHRQYERSAKPAPPGSFDADHHKHAPPPKTPPSPAAVETAEPHEHDEKREPQSETDGIWVPLSFGLMALFGAFLLWRLMRPKDDGRGE